MAEKMTVKAAAKINLALDVTGKLDNGYHTIESVFQSVGLYDEVTVELADDISVSCDVPEEFAQSDEIPCDERRNISPLLTQISISGTDTECA